MIVGVIKQIYHVLGGVFAKNTSLEPKFPSAFGSGNTSSLDWYFSQIPLPSMIYLYIVTPYIRMLDSDWLIAVIFFFYKFRPCIVNLQNFYFM
jgi:hypothetical protein